MTSLAPVRIVLVATLLAAGAAPRAAQTPTFSARLEVVRLDVLVTQNGRPLRDLQAADFEVRDNGVQQTLDHVSFEEIPLSVVLTLDISDSVTGQRLVDLREAGDAVLAALRAGDQAALVTFTTALRQSAPLSTDVSTVRTALAQAQPSGATALVDGAYAGVTIADTAAGRGLVIVFSDGRDTASWLRPQAVLDAARRSNAVVYAVSSGTRDPSFLRDIASVTGGRLYEVEATGNLRHVFVAALEEFRHRYVVSYTPHGVEKRGWHQVNVRVKRSGVAVRARPGYLAES